MFTKNRIVALVVVCSLALTIALNATIVSADGCNGTNKQFDEITWGLAIGVLCFWVFSVLAIAWKTGLGFGFKKFQPAGEYVFLTIIGSVVLPAIILSAANDTNHTGQIRSDMNNIALLGLVTSVWVILSTSADVMFNKKLYSMVMKQLGVKKTKHW